jgi:UDP-N-acetylglucosamine--N-acetylmuramyl-(pentapeptide) pyrophosphoryl-undecaprenol N-acetylglucosamine transferase
MSIPSGKLRRYFSWRNLVDPIFVIAGFFKASFYILKHRPSIMISAGSFVSVPVVWAAWFFGVSVLVHQQDVRPGLANKLMSPFADVVTVTFEKSFKDYGDRAIWIGNFVRKSLKNLNNKELGINFDFKSVLPIVLVVGGGTGATAINKLIEESIEELTMFCQVVHVTGKGKSINQKTISSNYQQFEFLQRDEISEALRVADVVVTRAGLGTLTEIAYLEKPSIIIPMPDSHQEENAQVFRDNNAAFVLNQKDLTKDILIDKIRELLSDKELQKLFSENVSKVIKKGANERVVGIIEGIIG